VTAGTLEAKGFDHIAIWYPSNHETNR